MSGISILKDIRNELLKNTYIFDTVSEGIFPYVVEEDAIYPFIVLKKNSLIPSYTKDGVVADNIQIEINVVADSYIKSINIAEAVRLQLEKKRFNGIFNVELLNNSDDFVGDAYVSKMIFKLTK